MPDFNLIAATARGKAMETFAMENPVRFFAHAIINAPPLEPHVLIGNAYVPIATGDARNFLSDLDLIETKQRLKWVHHEFTRGQQANTHEPYFKKGT
jgi:hypothetical protein